MKRRITSTPAMLFLLLTAVIAGGISWGQNETASDAASEFEQLDARYRQILSRNPKPGASFERWYRLHLDAGRLQELVKDCKKRAEEHPDSSPDQILLALVCARSGNLERALKASGQAAKLSPQNYVPPLLQGELLQRLDRNTEAASAYAGALECNPPLTETMTIAQRLARLDFVAGLSDEALGVWEGVERRFPDNVSVLTEVAHQLAEHRQFDEAIRRWEQIRSLTRSDLDQRLNAGIEIAVLEAQRGRAAEAVAKFDQLLNQVRPDSWPANHLREKIETVLTEEGGYPRFVEFLEKRLEQHPDDVDTRLQLAFALERTGQVDRAEQQYRQAVRQAPSRRDLRQAYIASLESRQKIDEAAEQARRLTEIDPQDADGWALYGRLVRQRNPSGDPGVTERQVAGIWSHIPAIRPRDAQLALRTAELCRSAVTLPQQPEDELIPPIPVDFAEHPLLEAAGRHYREAVRRAPENPQYRVFLGEFLYACNHRGEAVDVWSKIIEPPGDTIANHILLAETLRKYGEFDRAISAARQAFSRDSRNVKVARLLVDLLSQAERFDDALEQLDVLREISDDPELQAGLRKQWVELTLKSKQATQTLIVLELKRDAGKADTEELWRLGLLYNHQEKLADAVDVLQAAVDMSPGDVALRRDFGDVLQNARYYERAAAQYHAIVERGRPSIQDYQRIIDLEIILNHLDEARQAALAILQMTPSDPEAYHRLADLSFLQKRTDEALQYLHHAVRLAPSDPVIRQELVHRLAQADRHDEAFEQCWRCLELTAGSEERLSLTETLMREAQACNRIQETLARLRELRDRQKQPRDYTMCLIAAYRHSERLVSARAELEKLVAERPDDMPALTQLVELLESIKNWKAAARWQAKIVAQDETAENVQQLVALYRRAGDGARAEAAWQRYVRSLSPQEQNLGAEVALRLIDVDLRNGSYARAQQRIEWSLTQLPGSTLLRYRLALVTLVQGDAVRANDAFDAAVRAARFRSSEAPASAQSRRIVTTGFSEEIHQLQAARRAYPLVVQIGAVRVRNRYRFDALRQALNWPENEIETLCVIGCYQTANQLGQAEEWLELRSAKAEQNPVRLRDAVLALAATNRVAGHTSVMTAMMKRLRDDPLPHLAYLLSDYSTNPQGSQSAPAPAELLPALKQSFQWIGKHRPDLRPHVVLNLARQLVVLGDRPAALNAYVETLRHDDAATRQAGAQALAAFPLASDDELRKLIEPSGVVPALVALLDDRSADVAIEAVKTLGGLGPKAEAAVPVLIDQFAHPEVKLRLLASRAVANIGSASVPPLIEALHSDSRNTQICAAMALQQLGVVAAPAVPVLTELLSAGDAELQMQTMDVIGAIGPEAKDAVPALMSVLETGGPELRRRAMLALSEIGPEAKAAVPLLIKQLTTGDRTNQRNAARCLGRIGQNASDALPALRKLLGHKDPFVRRQAERTIDYIQSATIGIEEPDPQDAVAVALHGMRALDVRPLDWPQWGGWGGRNATPEGADIPETWDVQSGLNIKWKAKLGSQTYGPPAVANGKIYVGTNNGNGYVARYPPNVDLGVLLCFEEATGQFLWQLSCPKLPTGRVHDWPLQGIPSTPLIDGDRLWLVTNRGEVVCLDTDGFRDAQNDGPYLSEPNQNLDEADIVWSFDMMGQLGVSQHNMANCSMTCAGDLLFVCTSNGVDETHLNLPNAKAPSFMAMNRWTGKVIWTDKSPGTNILHGQWCSPCYAEIGGVPQVIFGGGDGWLYSFVPEGDGNGNSELIWKFDCNPKDSKWVLGGSGTRNNIIAFPAVYDGLLYVAVGQDPEHGEGVGHLWCIDPTGYGDVSPTLAVDSAGTPLPHRRLQAIDPSKGERAVPNPDSAVVWHFDQVDANGDGHIDYEEEMHRTTATPVIKDGLVYVADFSGIVHCLDAKRSTPDLKPTQYWTYDTFSPVWDAPLVVDGKVYVGDEDGDITVLRHAKKFELLHEHYMEDSVKCAPIVADNVLYITTLKTLYAIEKTRP